VSVVLLSAHFSQQKYDEDVMAKTTKNKLGNSDLASGALPPITASSDDGIRARIAERAYQLYEQRGYIDGHDDEDWLAAERLVLAELSAHAKKSAKSPSRRRNQKAAE
jgi:hypothetical protein